MLTKYEQKILRAYRAFLLRSCHHLVREELRNLRRFIRDCRQYGGIQLHKMLLALNQRIESAKRNWTYIKARLFFVAVINYRLRMISILVEGEQA